MLTTTDWGPPYLLYLGKAATDPDIKTARGVAQWRPDWCVAQHRSPHCQLSLGLPDVAIAEAGAAGAQSMLIGTANAGGRMDAQLVEDVVVALDAGLHVVSGLHQRLADNAAIRAAAERNGRRVANVRDSPANLQVGNGRARAGRRLLTVGTDCSVGKMYTSMALEAALRKRGLAADFRATGQTGILVAGGGVPVDAVVSDFISGAVEGLSPARNDDGWDVIEGQGSLFHPSFAGVSLGLLHGAQPDALVLCHEPVRAHMRGLPGRALPDLRSCLEANLAHARLTNPNVQAVGVALNTARLPSDEVQPACERISQQLDLPCEDPVRMGVETIVDRLLECCAN